jgi:four helix bundle protein
MSRDHNRLEAFQLADRLVLVIYAETVGFPPEERYGVQAQLRRAAVSIPSNIVEGCARRSHGDYVRFLDIAFASACEADYLIGLSRRLGFLSDAQERRCKNLSLPTVRILQKLIAALANNRRAWQRADDLPARESAFEGQNPKRQARGP